MIDIAQRFFCETGVIAVDDKDLRRHRGSAKRAMVGASRRVFRGISTAPSIGTAKCAFDHFWNIGREDGYGVEPLNATLRQGRGQALGTLEKLSNE